jgi:hypothetical protein
MENERTLSTLITEGFKEIQEMRQILLDEIDQGPWNREGKSLAQFEARIEYVKKMTKVAKDLYKLEKELKNNLLSKWTLEEILSFLPVEQQSDFEAWWKLPSGE